MTVEAEAIQLLVKGGSPARVHGFDGVCEWLRARGVGFEVFWDAEDPEGHNPILRFVDRDPEERPLGVRWERPVEIPACTCCEPESVRPLHASERLEELEGLLREQRERVSALEKQPADVFGELGKLAADLTRVKGHVSQIAEVLESDRKELVKHDQRIARVEEQRDDLARALADAVDEHLGR